MNRAPAGLGLAASILALHIELRAGGTRAKAHASRRTGGIVMPAIPQLPKVFNLWAPGETERNRYVCTSCEDDPLHDPKARGWAEAH